MISTSAMLLEGLKKYASPKTKLLRMVRNGECYPIIKGLYETNKNVSPHLLAGSIYGPSYISFEYALSYYGLIPESVYTITNATFDKKKKKEYVTDFGTYTYRDVPNEAFPYGLRLVNEGEYWYRIATPEKAICDLLYTISPVKNLKELRTLLYQGFRIEERDLKQLNHEDVEILREKYHSTNIRRFCTLLKKL